MQNGKIIKSLAKKKMTTIVNYETAIHESAHVVVGHILGIKIISMDARGEVGQTVIESFYETVRQMANDCIIPSAQLLSPTCKALLSLIKMTCAGYCAESKLSGSLPLQTSDNENDRSILLSCLNYGNIICPNLKFDLSAIESEVYALLSKSHIWASILRIAKAAIRANGILNENQLMNLLSTKKKRRQL